MWRIIVEHADWIEGWLMSIYCGPTGGNCVEVAPWAGGVAVRDSKDPAGPALVFTALEWGAFLAGVREGQFDLSQDTSGSRAL
jgi:hypothetical protein